MSISDYEPKSGDSMHLNLTHDIPQSITDGTNKEVVAHFDLEFRRLIRGDLPYHDAEKGRSDRFSETYEKYGEHDNPFEIFSAQEEARRRSLYGPNPGAVYCLIRIARREFPVLYEMECSVVANAKLVNRGGLTEMKLGYSTPEHIIGELKGSLTEMMKDLSRVVQQIRSCR